MMIIVPYIIPNIVGFICSILSTDRPKSQWFCRTYWFLIILAFFRGLTNYHIFKLILNDSCGYNNNDCSRILFFNFPEFHYNCIQIPMYKIDIIFLIFDINTMPYRYGKLCVMTFLILSIYTFSDTIVILTFIPH